MGGVTNKLVGSRVELLVFIVLPVAEHFVIRFYVSRKSIATENTIACSISIKKTLVTKLLKNRIKCFNCNY